MRNVLTGRIRQTWRRAMLVGAALALAGCQTQAVAPPPPVAAPIVPPAMIDFTNGQQKVLVTPMVYTLEDSGQSVAIPAGFVTDLASTPRVLWAFLPPFGYYQKAAVMHDFLYWKQECIKAQADKILYLAMEESGVSTADRITIYDGVRLGGGPAWRQNQRDFQNGLTRFVQPDASGQIHLGATDTWDGYRKTHGQTANDQKAPSPPAYCALADQLYADAL